MASDKHAENCGRSPNAAGGAELNIEGNNEHDRRNVEMETRAETPTGPAEEGASPKTSHQQVTVTEPEATEAFRPQ